MASPHLVGDPELQKIKTKDDEFYKLRYKTEKYDHENILKSFKIDNHYYKKTDESFYEKNKLSNNTDSRDWQKNLIHYQY